MATVSYAQLMGYAIGAGFSPALAPVMAAIAEAESSGNPDATHTNSNGSVDSGLWQINTSNSDVIAQYGNVFDPASNARMAYAIYKRQGLNAWTTYSSGAYRSHLSTTTVPITGTGQSTGTTTVPTYTPALAQSVGYTGEAAGWDSWWQKYKKRASGTAQGNGVITPDGITQLKSNVTDEGNAFVTEFETISHFFADLTSVTFWKRAGLFAVGVFIVLFGLHLWSGGKSTGTVSGIAKVAATAAA